VTSIGIVTACYKEKDLIRAEIGLPHLIGIFFFGSMHTHVRKRPLVVEVPRTENKVTAK